MGWVYGGFAVRLQNKPKYFGVHCHQVHCRGQRAALPPSHYWWFGLAFLLLLIEADDLLDLVDFDVFGDDSAVGADDVELRGHIYVVFSVD